MSLLHKAGTLRTAQMQTAFGRIFRWNSRFLYLEIAVIISLGIAAGIYGRHLLDLSVPVDGDVRSHIFKIEILYSYLAQFSWPQWVPYWYDGIPMDQYYPPGFYFLGAIFTFIFKHAVIAYKLLLFLVLAALGLVTYYFSRRFLELEPRLSILCLVAYGTSTPLLINFMYGEGPNLLGWSVALGFLAVYLGNAVEGRTGGLMRPLSPGLLLGATVLIHPFPAIFAIMAAVLFQAIRLLHFRSRRTAIRSQFIYLAAVFGIGAVIGAFYWVPALLTLEYASPIYAITRFSWIGGTIYILSMTLLALVVGLIARMKTREGLRMDFLIACLSLASALGFGATRYLPLGLGSFVQDFRFATILTPLFAILLTVFALSHYRPSQLNAGKVIAALIGGVLLAALVLLLDSRFLLSETESISSLLSSDFPQFALMVVPYFTVILFFASSLGNRTTEIGRRGFAFSLAAGICLVSLVSVIPYIQTGKLVNMGRLFSYVEHYQQPEYSETMESVTVGRLVVPLLKGYLAEGDSPVTFGWRWQVETVNGPYNQGDPKFFKHTVHLEWEERWLDYEYTRENLMQECAARYIFVRDSFQTPLDLKGMRYVSRNGYGQVLELDQDVYRAVSVTPVLMDVREPKAVTEFFNILLPEGYRVVLVDVREIDASLRDRFDYVLLDDESRLSEYGDKSVFLLKSVNGIADVGVTGEEGILELRLPYLAFTDRYFYHGDEAHFYAWSAVDFFEGARPTPEDLAALEGIRNSMGVCLDGLEYTPAGYRLTGNKIELATAPGFTLVKDSYFPYWGTEQGEVVSTIQGFMLVYSDDSIVTLNYRKPLVDILAAILTLVGVVAASAVLAASAFARYHRKKSEDA